MIALVLLAVIAATPPPPVTPLRTITNVRVREMCTTLHDSIAPAMAGIAADDALAAQGQQVLDRLGSDARGEDSTYGGAGARVTMDNMRIERIIADLVTNTGKVQKFLDTAAAVAPIAGVRARLQAILAGQKSEINVLSFVGYSNDASDLQAKEDPVVGMSGTPPPAVQADRTPLTLPDLLLRQRQALSQAEHAATQSIAPLIASCRTPI